MVAGNANFSSKYGKLKYPHVIEMFVDRYDKSTYVAIATAVSYHESFKV